MAAQPWSASVPLLLYGVSGGRTYAGPPHEEGPEEPPQDGGQLPQVCGFGDYLRCRFNSLRFHLLTRYISNGNENFNDARSYPVLCVRVFIFLFVCVCILGLVCSMGLCA